MARTRNVAVEEEVVVAEEAAVDEAPKSNKSAVTVVWRAGSREYSKAVHGDDFLALAKEFAAKKEGKLV